MGLVLDLFFCEDKEDWGGVKDWGMKRKLSDDSN